ncbi:hypothetical protein NDU88_004340 [Pleurodeles waltl]|uniref:Uncharacterized protein n=1 Tax=Pleurodeles waltl TaxID=8319 RepID=A0AAV7SII2_PLEWA|nr:hypothetical protein NDU88_004340 [Pleurodeles waltl]
MDSPDRHTPEPEQRSPTSREESTQRLREVENLTQCLPDRRSPCDFVLAAPEIYASSPECLKTPQPEEDSLPSAGNRRTTVPA